MSAIRCMCIDNDKIEFFSGRLSCCGNVWADGSIQLFVLRQYNKFKFVWFKFKRYFEFITKIRFFFCKRRPLKGTVSSSVALLQDLEYLGLNYNELHSTLPTQIAQLSKLTAIHMYSNNFIGPIVNLSSPLSACWLQWKETDGQNCVRL